MASSLPPPLPFPLPEAPGARASRLCGLLSILCAITCIGSPAAIVLGILALLQHAKAGRRVSEFPQEYRRPTSSGQVMGIVGLAMPVLIIPLVGIASAVAIPAFIGYQGKAANMIISHNLTNQLEVLAREYAKGREVGLDQPAIHSALEQLLRAAQERNPVNSKAPASRYSISIISASSEDEAAQEAEAEATTPGEAVFVLAFPPEAGQSGYLAGAARLKVPVNEESITSKGVTLD